MNNYETSATVGGYGEIHLVGVPFVPGTEVEVIVTAKDNASVHPDQRVQSLFAALDCARNSRPIGKLNRDELYDRNDVY